MAKVQQTMREKVDSYLKDALAENSEAVGAKLLGKAVYWNGVAAKQQTESPFAGRARSGLRTAGDHAGCG